MAPGTIAALWPRAPPRGPAHPAGLVETIWAPYAVWPRLGPLAVPVAAASGAGSACRGYVSNAMAIPLFKHLGYTNTDIATVTKLFGFWIALGGTFRRAPSSPDRDDGEPSPRHGGGSASHLALACLAWHGGHGGAAFWTFAAAWGSTGSPMPSPRSC